MTLRDNDRWQSPRSPLSSQFVSGTEVTELKVDLRESGSSFPVLVLLYIRSLERETSRDSFDKENPLVPYNKGPSGKTRRLRPKKVVKEDIFWRLIWTIRPSDHWNSYLQVDTGPLVPKYCLFLVDLVQWFYKILSQRTKHFTSTLDETSQRPFTHDWC